MNENAPTKTLLIDKIPMADFELIEREARRQQRPVVYMIRQAAAQMARRIEAREQRQAARAADVTPESA